MKNFLKPTLLKIVITILILIIVFSGRFLYSRNAVFNETTSKIEAPLGIEILHQISIIISYPTYIVVEPFDCIGTGSCSSYIDSFVAFGIFLTLIIECYLLSCLISFPFRK